MAELFLLNDIHILTISHYSTVRVSATPAIIRLVGLNLGHSCYV